MIFLLISWAMLAFCYSNVFQIYPNKYNYFFINLGNCHDIHLLYRDVHASPHAQHNTRAADQSAHSFQPLIAQRWRR